MLGLATRSRVVGGLRANAGSVREPNRKGKLVINIMGEPARPPKIPRGGPLCSWGLPRVGGITFRVALLVLTYPDPKWQQVTQFHLKVNKMQRQTRGRGKGS